MNNDYNKYIKYKSKYLVTLNQYERSIGNYRASTCNMKGVTKLIDCNINFNNNHGTCWMLSIFMIFLFSDSTSKCVQNKLYRNKSTDMINYTSRHLLKIVLPDNIYKKKELLITIIEKLQEKFNIKYDDNLEIDIPSNTPTMRRQYSKETEDEIVNLYFNFINYNNELFIKEKEKYKYGGRSYHNFFFNEYFKFYIFTKIN
jgi:hypothetical protein